MARHTTRVRLCTRAGWGLRRVSELRALTDLCARRSDLGGKLGEETQQFLMASAGIASPQIDQLRCEFSVEEHIGKQIGFVREFVLAELAQRVGKEPLVASGKRRRAHVFSSQVPDVFR